MNATKNRPSRKPRAATARGFGMVEVAISVSIVVFLLVGLLGMLQAQARSTLTITRETAARHMLDGELERIRAGAGPLSGSERAEFEPYLERSRILRRARFFMTVTPEETPGLVRVRLEAVVDPDRPKHVVSAEGVFHAE